MSLPLKAARRAANDVRPAPVFSSPRPIRTIKLTYRPSGPSRAAIMALVLALGGMTGSAAWFAGKALALFVAAR